jgi:hypothetical protein
MVRQGRSTSIQLKFIENGSRVPIFLASIFFAIAVSADSAKALYCSKPSAPFCVNGSGYFDDQYELDNCKRQVESFIDDANEYAECLDEEKQEVINEANEVISEFNCRIEGRSYC